MVCPQGWEEGKGSLEPEVKRGHRTPAFMCRRSHSPGQSARLDSDGSGEPGPTSGCPAVISQCAVPLGSPAAAPAPPSCPRVSIWDTCPRPSPSSPAGSVHPRRMEVTELRVPPVTFLRMGTLSMLPRCPHRLAPCLALRRRSVDDDWLSQVPRASHHSVYMIFQFYLKEWVG